jgi:myo-inositol 2-dehydrogenase / D-chiro-inositol 1-dehydrogenase
MATNSMNDMNQPESIEANGSDRRSFLKTGTALAAGAAVAGQLSIAQGAHAFGSDEIKIGLIGCGGRGTGAAGQALNTSGGGVKLVAVADAFENNANQVVESLKKSHAGKVDVKDDKKFSGLLAYKQMIESSDCDLVILATPPGFRPLHFETAINAGKHVFMEKPVASDAPGVRRVLAANEIAKQKGLAVQVGLQRRHQTHYQEMVKRIHDGIIGDVVYARAYWNGAGVWTRPRKPNQTELNYQCNNWYYFNWLSGDHIVEQHIHNLDVVNWVLKGYPIDAQGQGGRQVRVGAETGQIFDHHFVEYGYEGNIRMLSQCRHMADCWSSVTEHFHGTKGYTFSDTGQAMIYDNSGKVLWASEGEGEDGWQEEHHDMFAAIRAGEIPNEGEYAAKSTMTAILGRLATYSGRLITWKEAFESKLALADFDSLTNWDIEAPVKPDEDGNYPIPEPGADLSEFV